MIKEAKENPFTSIAIAIALALGGGNLALRPEVPEYMGPTQEEVVKAAERLTKIEFRLEQIIQGKETDGKHWKFLTWLETCVRDLAHRHDTRLEPKPEL